MFFSVHPLRTLAVNEMIVIKPLKERYKFKLLKSLVLTIIIKCHNENDLTC